MMSHDKDRQKENSLAMRIRRSKMSPAQLAELDELRRTSIHPLDQARSAALLQEAQEPPDPMDGFADEAENKLDQDLMLLENGHRTRPLLRRLRQFKDFVDNANTHNTEFAEKYRDRILAAWGKDVGPSTYCVY